MLGELGVEAHHVLVNTRDEGLNTTVLPSVAAFNHCIVGIEQDGAVKYLDLTANNFPFGSLPVPVIHQVVQKFVLQLEAQLAERRVTFELSPEAIAWLADKGYDERMGARPLGRVIQENLKKPLAEELLFGKLTKGGVVRVGVKDDKLDLKIEPATPPRLTDNKPPLLTAE